MSSRSKRSQIDPKHRRTRIERRTRLRTYRRILRFARVAWLAIVIAGLIAPSFVYFTRYAPPWLPFSGFVGLVISVLVLCVMLSRRRDAHSTIRTPMMFFALSLILFATYAVTLQFTTALPPAIREQTRFQTGFCTAEWSLTEEAMRYLEVHPNSTPQELMLAFGAFTNAGPAVVWRPWTIAVAAVLLIVEFMFGLAFWMFGLAFLGHHIRKLKPAELADLHIGHI